MSWCWRCCCHRFDEPQIMGKYWDPLIALRWQGSVDNSAGECCSFPFILKNAFIIKNTFILKKHIFSLKTKPSTTQNANTITFAFQKKIHCIRNQLYTKPPTNFPTSVNSHGVHESSFIGISHLRLRCRILCAVSSRLRRWSR